MDRFDKPVHFRRLPDVGYRYIGTDQFAKRVDDLAVVQHQGRLHRNFQGYSTHSEAEMVSCGVSDQRGRRDV